MHRLFFINSALICVLLGLQGCSDSDSGGDSASPNPSDFPSVGVPDQNSISLSASELNSRSFDFDGTTVEVSVRLADQLNNNATIPDGTEVFFATEGGSIEPMCMTTGGSCSVMWESQNPRPAAGPLVADPLGSGSMVAQYSAGRATVVAWTLGTESFTDNNSNGFFDDGDTQVSDIGEPFLDKNENGTRELDEEFVNFPITQIGSGGTYNPPDGLYAGVNCSHSTLCAPDQSLFVFDTIELVMSSDAVIVQPVTFNGAGGFWEDATLAVPTALSAVFSFVITDFNGNPLPVGTTITFAASVGTVDGTSSFEVANTNLDSGRGPRYPFFAQVYTAVVTESTSNTTPEAGTLTVTIDPPDTGPVSVGFAITDP